MEKIKKIINIEDSVGKHWDINRALSWNGYPDADLATNAEKGIAMIEKAIAEGNPYELLITDMHFGVNGVDDTKAGCVFYNRSRDLSWDFREVLSKLR